MPPQVYIKKTTCIVKCDTTIRQSFRRRSKVIQAFSAKTLYTYRVFEIAYFSANLLRLFWGKINSFLLNSKCLFEMKLKLLFFYHHIYPKTHYECIKLKFSLFFGHIEYLYKISISENFPEVLFVTTYTRLFISRNISNPKVQNTLMITSYNHYHGPASN